MISRDLFDAIADAVIVFDNQGQVTDANAQAVGLFDGRPRSGLIGWPIDELLPGLSAALVGRTSQRQQAIPAVAQQVALRLRAQTRTGVAFAAEVLVRGVGPRADSARVATVRVRLPAGSTDKDQTADSDLRQMAESVEVGFSLRELGAGGFSYVSPGFRRMFALGPQSSAPSLAEVTSRIDPDDLGVAAAAAARVEGGENARAELRIHRPAGDLRWIEFSSSPVTDDQGVVVRVAATVEDVTERKAAETALRMSEERFRRIAGALQIGVTLRELNPTRFLYVNQKYLDIVGSDPTLATPAEIDAAEHRIHSDDRTGVMAEYWRRSNAGKSAWAEMRLTGSTGKIQWLRLTSHPIEVNRGDVQMAAGSIEDITATKSAEAALAAALREADLANLAKSEFLSRMSHELRTPLNAVLGFAQILELELSSDSQLDAVRHILGGGRHLLAMINDLLDISRIEIDQLEFSIEPVAISDIVIETVGLLRPLAARHGVAVRFDKTQPDAAGFVLADRRRLRQVVLNLLSNAIKYNKRAGHVEIHCAVFNQNFLTLAVTDSGIGIRQDELHRLFSPFDRLGQQATEIDGAGIGLALSHRLIERMGGRLEVASTWGKGSTFTVVIPLAPVPGALMNGPGHDHQIRPPGAGAATLLYVEDNRSNVELMARVVSRRPEWTLVHAADGAAGLRLAPGLLPELIFLDLHLSDSDGIDLLRAVRADPDTATIPLVVVSADASPGQIERLRNAGADDYLTKPFDVSEILRVLDHYQKIGSAAKAHRSAAPHPA